MRIKLNTACIVGNTQFPVNAGSVLNLDDAEAKALVAIGYASETNEAVSAEYVAYGEATGNKAPVSGINNADDKALLAFLDGSVAEVADAIESLDIDQVKRLGQLEAGGQQRKGVAHAVEAYLAAQE